MSITSTWGRVAVWTTIIAVAAFIAGWLLPLVFIAIPAAAGLAFALRLYSQEHQEKL